MRANTTVQAVLAFDVAEYVRTARTTGRELLDPPLRARMAELYVDLLAALRQDDLGLSEQQRAALRLARLLTQAEWRLSFPAEAVPRDVRYPGPDKDVPGKRYVAYANLRLLNAVLGTNRHCADRALETRCWRVLHALTGSWLAYESRTRDASETWCPHALPETGQLDERIERLTGIVDTIGRTEPDPPPAASSPPGSWPDYLGPGWTNVLEYLINLPQTTMHEENAFLRIIHLTEVTNWAMTARVMAATEWLKSGRWAQAAVCLTRAARLAEVQLASILVLRRTMPVDRFLGFRAATGQASAVQTLSGQLLHIHLTCVHPGKVRALSEVPENAYLLLHHNPGFEPLRKALGRIPREEGAAADALAAAHRFDELLFRWRRVHLGLAHRYLPKGGTGSGGTSGASYLQGFYLDRLFEPDGRLAPQPAPGAAPALSGEIRARSAFSPLN